MRFNKMNSQFTKSYLVKSLQDVRPNENYIISLVSPIQTEATTWMSQMLPCPHLGCWILSKISFQDINYWTFISWLRSQLGILLLIQDVDYQTIRISFKISTRKYKYTPKAILFSQTHKHGFYVLHSQHLVTRNLGKFGNFQFFSVNSTNFCFK